MTITYSHPPMVVPSAGRKQRQGFLDRLADQLENRTSLVLFVGDLLVFSVALVITLLVRYEGVPSKEIAAEYAVPFSIIFVLWTAVFLTARLYDHYVDFDREAIPRRLLKVQAINMLLAAGVFFVLAPGPAPMVNLTVYLVVSTTLLSLWRLYLYLRFIARHALHALVIGGHKEAAGVRQVLSRNPYFRQVQVERMDASTYPNARALGEAVNQHIAEYQTDLIIADMDDAVAQELIPVFFNATFTERRTRFYTFSDFYEQLHHRIPPALVKESWLLQNVSTQAPHYAYDFLKRVADVTGALLLAVPCLILFPVIIAAIKWHDGGPIFYRTERVGRFNRPIYILKFRTMTGMDVGNQALQSKLRVTKLGRFLRKLRLDELPQLINVLRGDVSFVGPRPEMPPLAQVYAREIPHYDIRHLMKPGLSGWAQINNLDAPRQGVDIERTSEKLSFDLYYLRHRSLLLDLEIVLKTIHTVLSRSGA